MCGTGLLAGSFSMAAGIEGVRQVLLIGLAQVELVRDGDQHEESIEVAQSATGRDAAPDGRRWMRGQPVLWATAIIR